MPIVPSSLSLEGGEVILLTDAAGTVWSSSVGTLWTNEAATTPYSGTSTTSIYFKAYNRTTSGLISSTANTAAVDIIGILPKYPNYPLEWEGETRGVVMSIARSGRRRGRVLGDEGYTRDYKLMFQRRRPSEVLELEEFHAYHYPDKVFKYENLWHNISGYFYFDSKLKGRAESRAKGNIELALAGTPFEP